MVWPSGLFGPEVLEQHRHAAERPFGEVRGGRQFEGVFELAVDDGVEFAVQPFDPVDGGLHRLDGGEVAAPDPVGQADGVFAGEFVVAGGVAHGGGP